MEQSVPKRRHVKFKGRGITHKKEYSVHNITYDLISLYTFTFIIKFSTEFVILIFIDIYCNAHIG